MASGNALDRLAKVWQLPLLLASFGLFGYAAFKFIGPRPGITVAQRIEFAQAALKAEHYTSALDQCNKLLNEPKLTNEQEAEIHLMLGMILSGAQKEHGISLQSNHERIVAQIRQGISLGAKATSDTYVRLGESLEAIDKSPEALEAYQQALKLDEKKPLALQRKVIELELSQPDPTPAEPLVEQYLKDKNLSNADRAWALGGKAQTLINRGKFADAKSVLNDALAITPKPLPPGENLLPAFGAAAMSQDGDSSLVSEGTIHYWLGYCDWKLGDLKEAERLLRVARDQLGVGQTLDADAAFILGKVRQAQHDPKEAASFYEAVLLTHPESRPAPLAKLNRGLCRIALDDDPAGLNDFQDVIKELQVKKNGASYTAEAVAGLKEASTALAAKNDLAGAIEVLEDEQILVPEPDTGFYLRLAGVLERQADQLEQTLAQAKTPADKDRIEAQVRKIRVQAGDSYIALSRGLTLADDRGQGEAMWKGVNLYDSAGATQQSIEAMEYFVAQRPDDGQTPDALLRLGRAYQSLGQFDNAIKKLQLVQFRYPQSLAATRSGVPLSQVYIAKGPEFFPKAEKVLLAVIENNPILTPESEEFRQAMIELGQLYYRTGRYEYAISRLEETTQRYPTDPRMGQLVFLMADSYRKSAGLLLASTKAPPSPTDGTQLKPAEALAAARLRNEAVEARRDRLAKAKALFDRVIEIAQVTPPVTDMDKLYLKLSTFYRADCLYDLGRYEEAIKLYDTATLRYQGDPSSVAAYVQEINAYCILGRFDDARTATERAKWLLRQMPESVFADDNSSMPKKYWEDWLNGTTDSGIYAKDLKRAAVTAAQ